MVDKSVVLSYNIISLLAVLINIPSLIKECVLDEKGDIQKMLEVSSMSKSLMQFKV